MFKRISLQWRLTLFTAFLIGICCIGLSVFLNVSAYRMVDSIDSSIGVYDTDNLENESTDFVPSSPSSSLNAFEKAKNNYLSESLAYTTIAIIIGGILTYYVSGKALEPIRDLNKNIKNININHLNESLEVPQTKDEIAELTTSFNEMMEKTSYIFQLQKQFSANAAHELRTPLAVLQTKLDVFSKKKNHSDVEYEKLLEVFKKQIKRMRSLIKELLDIANMEHTIQNQVISLEELINETIDDLFPLANEYNIKLIVKECSFYILGDYDLLYRAFYNLIENAIKYNNKNGSVIINANIKNENIVIMIQDTGIGIPDSMKKQIFEPFFRIDKSRSRELGGAGLGLAFVKDIIQKHNGTITVENKEKGSCFTIILNKCKDVLG